MVIGQHDRKLLMIPCHHMEDVFANPAQLPNWQAAADGQQVDWDEVFAGYNTAVDWPTAHYWRELAAFYPDAEILLSVRPAGRWWESFSGTIKKILEIRSTIPDAYPRSVTDMANKIILLRQDELVAPRISAT